MSQDPHQHQCEGPQVLVEPKSGELLELSSSAEAPAGKGYWDPAWKSYLSLAVSEEHGYARTGYPVHATVGVLANYLSSPDEVRVVKAEPAGADVVYKEVPSQIYDVVTWNDPKVLAVEEKDAVTGEKVDIRYHPTTTFSVAFLADVGAGKKASYLVFYDNRCTQHVAVPDYSERRVMHLVSIKGSRPF